MSEDFRVKQRIPTDLSRCFLVGIFTDEDSSLELVAGAGDAHDRNIGLIPEDLICFPILEGLR